MTLKRTKSFIFKVFMLALVLVVIVGAFSACSRSNASVVVSGSSSMLPYVEKLAHEYNKKPGVKHVDVQGGGSSAGIIAAKEGIADIGMSSRTLKPAELDLWSVEIAKDGLAIVVHPDNPIIKKTGSSVINLSSEQIRAIYAGDITNWKDLGGNDAKINVVTREAGSGTRSAFEELVMGAGNRISSGALVMNSNGLIRMVVSDDKNAIGFISMGLVEGGAKSVVALKIDGVEATASNVLSGDYKLARGFIFVAKEEPTGDVKAFVDFVLSEEGKDLLRKEGLIIASGDASV